jgi:trimeric autotransporter adhesin
MRKTLLWVAMAGLMVIVSTGGAFAYSEDDTDTWLGMNAADSLTAGEHSGTFIGAFTGYSNTTGASNSFMGYQAGYSNTTGRNNSFLGAYAGVLNTTGIYNSFMGSYAGYYNTTGIYNSFMGANAGQSNTTGDSNSFLGYRSGYSNTTGNYNSFIGRSAGYSNSEGVRNVFLGYSAGYSETGSDKLYIDNCYVGGQCTDPLIYGEFDNRLLKLGGSMGIGISPAYTVDVSGGGISQSQLHFSLSGTDTGGWVTSVADNNFWLSSGAVWDSVAGGWVQKSADQLAVMAGSGPSGYRVITRSGCPVDTVCQPTTRMTIDYTGQVGFGITPTYPLHMVSGARVTIGGVWTDASSRDYKEDIQELSPAAAMSTLQGLNPVTFKYKAAADERHVGFIAEDVPELVATKDRKGMSSMDVVAVLTRVVKEQHEAIQEQQEANQELMKKLAALETEVKRLGDLSCGKPSAISY